MALGNCDNCDRQNVPVSSGQFCGCDTTQCFICQGDSDPDPYGEIEITCECDGEGCDACSGCGTVWIETQPVTLDDLNAFGGHHVA